jgi:hypothetical protein
MEGQLKDASKGDVLVAEEAGNELYLPAGLRVFDVHDGIYFPRLV